MPSDNTTAQLDATIAGDIITAIQHANEAAAFYARMLYANTSVTQRCVLLDAAHNKLQLASATVDRVRGHLSSRI